MLIKDWQGCGSVRYTDESALPGRTYTYYIMPVHVEMRVGGGRVQGPATQKKTVATKAAVIDIKIPGITPAAGPGASPAPSATPAA